MTPSELHTFLGTRSNEDIVDKDILGRRPWLFETDTAFTDWREVVAAVLSIALTDVWIVGSAATGFSLSPLKPGRGFRSGNETGAARSDVDIAFVSNKLFTSAWDTITDYDRGFRLWGDNDSKAQLRRDIYWGLVSDSQVPRNTDAARAINRARAIAGRERPIRGHEVRCRVYRRQDDLRAYHIASLRGLRRALSELKKEP
jgi:hypothetical protein